MTTVKSALLATAALLTGFAQAGAPAQLQTAYADGGLWRYRVGCDAYRGNYCQDFVRALNTVGKHARAIENLWRIC
jgi:predicted cupin superfamily sugar epimerase